MTSKLLSEKIRNEIDKIKAERMKNGAENKPTLSAIGKMKTRIVVHIALNAKGERVGSAIEGAGRLLPFVGSK